jgi:Tetratricopeptide repeat
VAELGEIAKKPGISEIVLRVERKPVVPAKPGHLTIAVAHLEDDQNRQHEKLLRDALANDFEGAETKSIDRTIAPPDADTDQDAIARAKDEADRLRKSAGADVLLWGRAVTLNNKSEMRLYWTTGRDFIGVKQSGLYQDTMGDTIAIPPLFWDDLKQVLGMLVQSRISTIQEELTGRYMADQLAPLIAQVRRLLQARNGTWNGETEAAVRYAFAQALSECGDQSGNNDMLQESIAVYRQVLERQTRERVPLEWAGTQNSLGNALRTLGERENGTARLEEAVGIFRAALEENTRARVPLEWARTQNSLGATLATLRQRESGMARLEEAVAAFRAALEEWTAGANAYWHEVAQQNMAECLALLEQRRKQ